MKLYLETSVINFLNAEDAPEKMKITREFFNLLGAYEIYISDIVLFEVEQASKEKREKLIDIIKKYKMKALESSETIEKLADLYIKENLIPKKYYNDALHIAIATKYKMDAIVSWNLTHIVRFKTKIGIKKLTKN